MTNPKRLSRILVPSLTALTLFGCGASTDSNSRSGSDSEPPVEAPALDVPRVEETTFGTLLTSVEVNPDHSVEIYELPGGGIAVGEQVSLDAPEEERLDLEAMGTQGLQQMYRTLVGDDRATVPEALIQAELHRAQQLKPENLLGDEVSFAQMPVENKVAEVGTVTLATQPVKSEIRGLSQALTPDETWFLNNYCPQDQVDATWCPTNAQGWAQTGWRETMFYDIHGFNAASSGNAVLTVDAWNSTTSTWDRALTRNLAPRTGYRWLFYNVGYYKSRVEGSLLHLAERYRLSQPSVSLVTTYPNDNGQSFYNDIQGFKHDADNWYLSRTQYSVGSSPLYGQLAKVPVGRTLASAPPVVASEPNDWKNAGFPHYGDIAYAKGLIYVPMDGSAGCSVGVFDRNLTPIGRTFLRSGGCGFLAYNPKQDLFYTGSGKTLDAYQINVNGSTVTRWYDHTLTLSADVGNIAGADFSAKGNLWVYIQYNSDWGILYGIDGFSGIIQKQLNVRHVDSDESEGLALWDLDADTRAPGMSGQIHVQDLSNDALSDDDLFVRHFRVSDVSRL